MMSSNTQMCHNCHVGSEEVHAPLAVDVDGAALQVQRALKYLQAGLLQRDAPSRVVLVPVGHLHVRLQQSRHGF